MVEIYTKSENYTNPYGYVTALLGVVQVKAWTRLYVSTISSWEAGPYAPRYQVAIL